MTGNEPMSLWLDFNNTDRYKGQDNLVIDQIISMAPIIIPVVTRSKVITFVRGEDFVKNPSPAGIV
jgi:hypothetical protein